MSDQLDQRLKQWAAETAPAPEALARLRQRIAEKAASQPTPQPCHQSAPPAPIVIRFMYSLAGAAAMLIAVCALWIIVRSNATGPDRYSVAETVSDAELGVAMGRQLFDEMDRVFPERLRWVAESNGDMGLGIESTPSGTAPDGMPMLMRLTVVARHDGEQDWRPAWSADVLVRSEDAVEIVPSRQADNRLSLWIYPLDDGHILVDSRITLESPMQLSAETDTVLRPGRPARLASQRKNNTDYRLYQTVWALNPEAGI